MKELTEGQKKQLSGDDQELVSAGFVCDRLDLISAGKEALWGILFEAHRKELVEVAKQRNAEDVRRRNIIPVTHCDCDGAC